MFAPLRAEIEEHMRAEEERLFPAVAALERHEIEGFPLEALEAYEAHHVRTAAAIRALRPLVADDPEAWPRSTSSMPTCTGTCTRRTRCCSRGRWRRSAAPTDVSRGRRR